MLGQHFTRDLHVKRDCKARTRTFNATHARGLQWICMRVARIITLGYFFILLLCITLMVFCDTPRVLYSVLDYFKAYVVNITYI